MTPIFWRKIRYASAFLFLTGLITLQSCVETSPVGPVPPPVGPEPLPENPCAPDVIEGYTDKVSYDKGEEVTVFLNSKHAVELCRLTIYDVNENETFSVASPLTEQTISPDAPSSNGFGFIPTVKIKLPNDLKSGVYLIENKIPFVVRTSDPVDLMIVYASNTANAYATSGGKSLYTTPPDKPTKVSFHRPIPLEAFSEYCLKWFEELEGFSIGYMVDSDLDDYDRMMNAKILVIVGHNEYWTRAGRKHFDRFVDEGGDALILSGNTMWWQVRYADDRNTLLCFKDVEDPQTDPLLQTKIWNTPELEYSIISSIGADFPRGGYGIRFNDNGWDGFKIINPSSPLFEGITLTKGQVISCPTTEFDGAPIASFDDDEFPIIDNSVLNFEKVELLGYDRAFRGSETFGTFIVFRKTATSGVVINTSTTDWCSSNGMGGTDGYRIKAITLNAITKLKNNQNVFSD